MATDIVPSLFGITPESYQLAQQQAASDRALAFAKLDPFQRASYGMGIGAYQLGRALGGEDPQLRMISNRNAIARQIDPTDLQSMMRGIQALQQAGDSVGAMQLAQVYQQRMKTLSDIAQNQAAAESSRASTGKTLAETEALRRKEAELIEATKAYRGEGGPAQPAQAQAAAPVEAAMPPSAAAQPAAQPVDRPVAAESVFPRKDAVFSNPTRAVSEDEAGRINSAIRTYNQAMQLAAGETPSWWAGKEPLDANARQKELGIAEDLRKSLETLYGIQLVRPYGTPSTAPRSPIVGTPSAPAAVASAVQAAPSAPSAPAAPAAQAADARDETVSRISQIETRLSAIRRARAAGVKDAELEGKQLEDELKSIREASKPTPLSRLIAERDQAIRNGADVNSSLVRNFDAAISKETGQQLSFGERANRYALSMFNGTSYINLTPTQQERVNKRITDEDKDKAKSGATVLPGQPIPPKDWIQFEKFLQDQPTFKQTAAMISAAPSVLNVIRQSTSNDFAARALPTSIAKLFDSNQLSDKDVARYARTGGLDDRLAAMAAEFFTGRVTSVTKQQAERFMTNVYRGALLEQRNVYASQADILGYADSPSFKKRLKQIDDELAKFREVQPQPSPGAAAAPGAGTAPGAGGRTMSREEENALLRKYGQNPGQNPR
jgi:hypothetical protein